MSCVSAEIKEKLLIGLVNRIAELNESLWSLRSTLTHIDDYNLEKFIYEQQLELIKKLKSDIEQMETCV